MLRYDSFLDKEVLSLFAEESKRNQISELELSSENYSINVDKIIEILDLELKTTKLDIHSGKFDSEQNIIYVNTDESEVRQRFTKAHELGHYVYKHGESARLIDSSFYNIIERRKETEANRFAVDLLMPVKLIYKLISEYEKTKFVSKDEYLESDPEDLINYLASCMEVSTQSMKYRLLNLNIINEI
ncbi:MAG: ImmA/IrrE family metallo-endopeptidase [Streptococcus parauberis]